MASRRRAICLGLVPFGALGLVFASGVVFWLALDVVAVALVGILLPGPDTERFVPVAMVVGSAFAGLALVETSLWLWEIAASEPRAEFVAADGAVPLAPDLMVHGMCLNEFLERGARQQASPALLPEKLTKFPPGGPASAAWSTSGPPPSSAS
jgi:hypothetical protein